jgi:hypothetical protein
MAVLFFGLNLDNRSYPGELEDHLLLQDEFWKLGPNGLLFYLEQQGGLVHPRRHSVLRTEQYRQLILHYLAAKPKNTDIFFKNSFEVDGIGTAEYLLALRDELRLSNWDFKVYPDTPKRLKELAEIEAILEEPNQDLYLQAGAWERLEAIKSVLSEGVFPFTEVFLCEPLAVLPLHWRAFFEMLKTHYQLPIHQLAPPALADESTDLGYFQRFLLKETQGGGALKNDGSLILIKDSSDAQLAQWMARWLAQNPTIKPLLFIPDKSQDLEIALLKEGMPGMGIASSSLARPALQILRLAHTLLWANPDPNKLIEFVSLPLCPLEPGLAWAIGKALSEKPGIKNDRWYYLTQKYFEDTEANADTKEKKQHLKKQREEYNFWFERTRYQKGRAIPKSVLIELYEHIEQWAKSQSEKSQSLAKQLISLRTQAMQLAQTLAFLPENERFISEQHLEKILQVTIEPSPMVYREPELGHHNYCHHATNILIDTPQLFWWNFVAQDFSLVQERWYPSERQYLLKLEIELDKPELETQRQLNGLIQPMLRTTSQLLLMSPAMVGGKTTLPHKLTADLFACFGEDNCQQITYDFKQNRFPPILDNLPARHLIPTQVHPTCLPHIEIKYHPINDKREQESYSSISNLLEYPHIWAFRHQLELYESTQFQVTSLNTLFGNLAHRFCDKLFKEYHDKPLPEGLDYETFASSELPKILNDEGSLLLQFGNELEKERFEKTLIKSVRVLLDAIKHSGYRVLGSEVELAGQFADIDLKGIADLVLINAQNQRCIVDLKWSSIKYLKERMENHTDFQLVLYAKLAAEDNGWANTAYFTFKDHQIAARNREVFANAQLASKQATNHQVVMQAIWDKMEKTYYWRKNQLANQSLEIRTSSTIIELEQYLQTHLTSDEIRAMIELPREENRWDAYRTLLGQYN